MLKKFLFAALFIIASAATVISVTATQIQDSMISSMTDKDLKAKIDSLAELEQPLTAAPFIAEAKKRASATHDTQWMLDIIKKDIKLNALRNIRTSSPSDELHKACQHAWTPLRQLLNLKLRTSFYEDDVSIDSILDDPDTLFSLPASQAGVSGWMASRNILEYATIAIINRDRNIVTDPSFFAPITEFIGSDANLPDNARAIQILMRAAHAHADTSSIAIAQLLRISLTSDDATINKLIAELKQLGTQSNPTVSALSDLAHATRILDKVTNTDSLHTPESIAQADAMISDAERLLSNAATLLSGSPFASFAKKTIEDINGSSLVISTDGHVVPNTYTPVYFSYRNIPNVTLRIFYLGNSEINQYDSTADLSSKLSHFKVALSKNIALPPTNVRTKLSRAAIELDGLPAGHYAIAAFVGDSLVCAESLVSSQISVNQISDKDKDYLLITDFQSGKSLPFAHVDNQGYADVNGWLTLKKTNGRKPLTVRKGNDSYSFYATSYSHELFSLFSDSERNAKILTDRNIYRPGQTIFFKVFVYDAFTDHLSPASPSSTFSIELVDPFSKTLVSKDFTVDDNGAAHGTIDIPSDVMKGQAYLAVKTSNGRRYLRREYVRIEDFKRTDNTVTIDPFSEALLPGATVTVSGSAMSAAGLPVANATVKYSVSSFDKKTFEGTSTTGTDGRFSFSFVSSNEQDQSYNVDVRVTDLKGETSECQRSCHITEKGTNIEISQERNFVEVNHQHLLTLKSLNSNGEPYAATLHLKLTPYNHTQPLRPCATSKADTILSPNAHISVANLESLASNPSAERDIDVCGSSTFDIASLNLAPGKYQVEVSAKALNGSDIHATTTVTVIASSGASPNLDYLTIVAPDEAQNGNTFSVKFCSGLANAVAHVFFVRRGNIEVRKSIPISCGVSSVDYSVPSDVIEGESLKIVALISHDGRLYNSSKVVTLRRPEKSITLNLNSFRNFSHPGAHERWVLTTQGADAVVASIYDSRLDKYANNQWYGKFDLRYVENSFSTYSRCPLRPDIQHQLRSPYDYLRDDKFDSFISNLFLGIEYWNRFNMAGLSPIGCRMMANKSALDNLMLCDMVSPMEDDQEVSLKMAVAEEGSANNLPKDDATPIRDDFSETVCFFPDLKPLNDTVTIDFNLPDNLTTYNFRALAYDHKLRSSMLTSSFVVRKSLNVRTGLPRFLVEQDSILLSADITVADTSITSAVVSISLTDTVSGKPVISLPDVNISFTNGLSQRAQWQLTVPVGIEALQIDVVAKANGASDGERHVIPIERRFVNVDESHTFTLVDKGSHVVPNPFTTGDTKCLSFSYTSNAFIEVLRALPILDNSRTPCADTYIGRFESSAIAALLAKRSDIRKAVDYLRDNATSDDAPSRIADAEHTPWLYVANLLRQHDRDVVRVMSADRAEKVKSDAIAKLAKLQKADGGFPWFDGMPTSNWLTISIAETLGNMIHLGLITPDEPHVSQILKKVLPFLNANLKKELESIKRYEAKAQDDKEQLASFIPYHTLTALHARLLTNPTPDDVTTALVDRLANHWQHFDMSNRVTALATLTLAQRNSDAQKILKSLEENLVQTNDGTAFLPAAGFSVRREQIEAQALLIMALQRLNPKSPNLPKLVNHLILMKRGASWLDVQCTSHAVLALLGSTTSHDSHDVVTVNDSSFDTTVSCPKVTVQLPTDTRSATVKKSDNVISWGSWSRTLITPKDQMDADSTDKLKILRSIEVRRTVDGSSQWVPADGQELSIGDEVRISMNFYNDEPLSFVRIRDFRAAALEPDDKLSGYRGWWWWRCYDFHTPPHYLVINDASMEFFIDHLDSGWHQLSYCLTVTANGDFSAGYSDATCMYNTDICAHSNGSRLSFNQ